uniref:ZP domain-containing protein n=1 Tax=Ditylenchus dipsaci TaxID=166011 RepID=A0A915DSF7_9BILA
MLYHNWECDYKGSRSQMYCMMVHNCTISTSKRSTRSVRVEQNARFKEPNRDLVQIIDEFGCSLYPQILPHVHYNGDLQGGLGANAFSLDIDKV